MTNNQRFNQLLYNIGQPKRVIGEKLGRGLSAINKYSAGSVPCPDEVITKLEAISRGEDVAPMGHEYINGVLYKTRGFKNGMEQCDLCAFNHPEDNYCTKPSASCSDDLVYFLELET
ncbi:hypothetical protein [Vibrio phage LP.1]|nr:hypothetical protein [Vibrio phage LP.1]